MPKLQKLNEALQKQLSKKQEAPEEPFFTPIVDALNNINQQLQQLSILMIEQSDKQDAQFKQFLSAFEEKEIQAPQVTLELPEFTEFSKAIDAMGKTIATQLKTKDKSYPVLSIEFDDEADTARVIPETLQ